MGIIGAKWITKRKKKEIREKTKAVYLQNYELNKRWAEQAKAIGDDKTAALRYENASYWLWQWASCK